MAEMIHLRESSEIVGRHDLFSSLLDANSGDLGGLALTEDELISNIYIFLLAGHETTAHTLCFTFGLLALYQEEQEKLYQHIRSTIPSDRLPSYEEMPLLTHSMASDQVATIPQVAAEDTTLSTMDLKGMKITVPVPKGADIVISVPGLHYNPRYWEDPHAFKPERFLKDWPRDAFVPFSAGARACVGRKFFETEGIAVLTMLISRYKITVKEEPQFARETFEERRARVLANRAGVTLTPLRVPLVFTRRT
ncbi:unnamed protein product [Cyclocybe aegerita]|uniref:Cytochrome P450 n=1 Tax=Cyclocybe aegerita TaxID=1973307 RepID=A0A8S0VZI9_CYCAE|nr:unnamed protein product [Cyclocybe aegerita]